MAPPREFKGGFKGSLYTQKLPINRTSGRYVNVLAINVRLVDNCKRDEFGLINVEVLLSRDFDDCRIHWSVELFTDATDLIVSAERVIDTSGAGRWHVERAATEEGIAW